MSEYCHIFTCENMVGRLQHYPKCLYLVQALRIVLDSPIDLIMVLYLHVVPGINKSTACGCQRSTMECLIEDKRSKSKKGPNSEKEVF